MGMRSESGTGIKSLQCGEKKECQVQTEIVCMTEASN